MNSWWRDSTFLSEHSLHVEHNAGWMLSRYANMQQFITSVGRFPKSSHWNETFGSFAFIVHIVTFSPMFELTDIGSNWAGEWWGSGRQRLQVVGWVLSGWSGTVPAGMGALGAWPITRRAHGISPNWKHLLSNCYKGRHRQGIYLITQPAAAGDLELFSSWFGS